MNQHMRPEPIPFIDIAAQRQRLGSAIDVATKRVLDHCQFISGPEVTQLETMLAGYCGANNWLTLGNEELAGIKQKLTVLSPDLSGALALDEDGALEPIYDRRSDAEQVMLLHRDAARLSAGDPRKLQ